VDLKVVMVVVGMLVVVLPLTLVLVHMIFSFRKNRKELRKPACDATAKSSGASLRSSQKFDDGKRIGFLLLLSL